MSPTRSRRWHDTVEVEAVAEVEVAEALEVDEEVVVVVDSDQAPTPWVAVEEVVATARDGRSSRVCV